MAREFGYRTIFSKKRIDILTGISKLSFKSYTVSSFDKFHSSSANSKFTVLTKLTNQIQKTSTDYIEKFLNQNFSLKKDSFHIYHALNIERIS